MGKWALRLGTNGGANDGVLLELPSYFIKVYELAPIGVDRPAPNPQPYSPAFLHFVTVLRVWAKYIANYGQIKSSVFGENSYV